MKLGATRVINAKEKDVLKEVEAFTNGVGIEKVFETAGSPVTIAQTPYLVKKGGTITLVGMAADPEVKFNLVRLWQRKQESNPYSVTETCMQRQFPQLQTALISAW